MIQSEYQAFVSFLLFILIMEVASFFFSFFVNNQWELTWSQTAFKEPDFPEKKRLFHYRLISPHRPPET